MVKLKNMTYSHWKEVVLRKRACMCYSGEDFNQGRCDFIGEVLVFVYIFGYLQLCVCECICSSPWGNASRMYVDKDVYKCKSIFIIC